MKQRAISSLVKEKNPVIVDSNVTVAEVARMLTDAAEGAAIITSSGKADGILTLADIVQRVVAPGLDPSGTTVGQVMTKNPVVIRSKCSIGHALYVMHEYGVHYVPVIDDDNNAVGVIRAADALASDLSEYAHEAEMLDHISEIL